MNIKDTFPDLCTKCQKKPIAIKKRRLCKKCCKAYYRERKRLKSGRTFGERARKKYFREIFPVAERLIIENQRAGVDFLKDHLRIGSPLAKKILDELERQGIIGPGIGGKSRKVMVTAEQSPPPLDPALNQRIKKLEQFISIIGPNSELGKLLKSVVLDLKEWAALKAKLTP